MWGIASSVVLTFLLTCLTYLVCRWRNPRSNGKLPPGSMGFPIIGESLEFFTPHATRDISPFMRRRIKRYGPVFRTSLVGHPVVVSTDPEVNRFIFQHEGNLFKLWYTDSFDGIVGTENLQSVHGSSHKYLRNLISSVFGIESLKQGIINEVEELTCKHLSLWPSQTSVDIKEAFSQMFFDFSVRKLFSLSESEDREKLRKSYTAFHSGLVSFPLSIPGTAYWKCVQGRREAMKIIKSMLDERRSMSSGRQEEDFLDIVVEETKKEESPVKEEIALNLLFALPFAAFETVSSALTLAIQYLSEHPLVLEELTKEHESILKKREKVESGMTWEEYKSMTFTQMVINETVRLANVVPGFFRKVLKDVEIQGYTIPAGWVVLVYPNAVHLSPALYDDPLKFDPWRWQGKELHAGSKTFMAFGGGARLCSGADLAKLEMAIFLHHLVIKYRWKVTRGEEPMRCPGVLFPNGFHVQILEKAR